MKRLMGIAVIFAALVLIASPTFAASNGPRVPPKGTEGPDVRHHAKVEPKGTEGPDVRAKMESRGIEGPDVR